MNKSLLFLCISLMLFSCNESKKKHPNQLIIKLDKKHKSKFHNLLDDIDSAAQLEAIIRSCGSEYESFKINELVTFEKKICEQCQELADSLNIRTWYKNDFDGNGYTDIITIEKPHNYRVTCIMDSGNNRFFIKQWTSMDEDILLPKVIEIKNAPLVLNYRRKASQAYLNRESLEFEWTLVADTLIYKYDAFIEYNNSVCFHKIKKIELSLWGDPGFFTFQIDANGKSFYEQNFREESDGHYIFKSDTSKFNLMVNLLNYLNFTKLDSHYRKQATDNSTAFIKITYENNQTKTIQDYGFQGTYGLIRLYKLFYSIIEGKKTRTNKNSSISKMSYEEFVLKHFVKNDKTKLKPQK